jgi:energy-coupling factor transport system substrate-specific component
MSYMRQRNFVLCALCVALNVGLGKVSNLLSLPFTMDTIGTIIAAAVLPWPYLLLSAALSSVLAAMIIHPAFIFFVGTQIVIAIVARLFVKSGMFGTLPKAGLAGLTIGICSAVVSAPVIAIIFGGVAVPSISALNAVFLASGRSLWASVISGSLIVESVDKLVAGLVAWSVLRRLSTPEDHAASR